MLVKEVMSPHPIVIDAEMSVTDALRIMKDGNIRHLPVIKEGRGLIGLITRDALNRAMPSELTSLSIWEINYQLGRIRVRDVMVKHVITATEDVTVEDAARTMIGKGIGSLPVLRDGQLVGIVTDVDLLSALSNLMAWRQPGVRVTFDVPDERGWLAKVTSAIAAAGGYIAGGGSYPSREPLRANLVFKVQGIPMPDLSGLLSGLEGVRLLDIRETPQ
jgi:acetoin utilization protein AcuB